jgi:hypothetical protein
MEIGAGVQVAGSGCSWSSGEDIESGLHPGFAKLSIGNRGQEME